MMGKLTSTVQEEHTVRVWNYIGVLWVGGAVGALAPPPVGGGVNQTLLTLRPRHSN